MKAIYRMVGRGLLASIVVAVAVIGGVSLTAQKANAADAPAQTYNMCQTAAIAILPMPTIDSNSPMIRSYGS